MRVKRQLEENEKVKKEHFVDEVKENAFTCYVCGSELWDERKNHIKYKATYRFKGRKTGDLMFACNECKVLVAIIRAKDMKPDN